MIINTNMASLNTIRQLGINEKNTQSSLAKLSSGLRINTAADDAAGLAISEKMRGQISGLNKASSNAQDGISLASTAEGALNETTSILQRMRELAVQAGNDTNTSTDRAAMQTEMNQLTSEVNRIGNTTEFNTRTLLDGSISSTGEAFGVKAGSSTLSANLSNLNVAANTTLEAGKYQISVENDGGIANKYQNIAAGQDAGTTLATVDSTAGGTGPLADVSLAEGTYKVNITSASATDTSNVGGVAGQDGLSSGAVQVFNTTAGNKPITVDAGSTLSGSGYYVEVDKTVDKQIGPVVAGGISDLKLTSGSEATAGTYNITTSAKVTDAGSIADISNVTIADNSTMKNTDVYTIKLTETADAANAAGTSKYTFVLQKGGADVAGTSLSVDVTASSGSTSLKLGDVSLDVNLATLWNKSDHNGTVDVADTYNTAVSSALTITNQVNVTQMSTGASVTKSFADNADQNDLAFDFTSNGGTGSLSLDVANASFVRGNTYSTNSTWTDKYAVSLKDSSNALQGTAVNLTGADLSDPSKLTNIQLGTAAQGTFADLSSTGLNSMTAGETVKMSFDASASMTKVAQLENIDGSSITGVGSFALNTSGGAGQVTDIGKGVVLKYNGGTVAAGDVTFSVKDVIPDDDFKMSLKQDTNNDGTYETTLVDKQAFNPNSTVNLGSTGISTTAGAAVTAADNAVFELESTKVDNSLSLQIGANTNQTMSVSIDDMRAKALSISGTTANGTITASNGKVASLTSVKSASNGSDNNNIEYSLDLSSATKATAAISVIDDAINKVSNERSNLGAVVNRLDHTINNLGTASQNITSAEANIRDVDMAKEMTNFQKNNILQQAAQAMLAQANQQPQGVLQLLR